MIIIFNSFNPHNSQITPLVPGAWQYSHWGLSQMFILHVPPFFGPRAQMGPNMGILTTSSIKDTYW